MLVTLYFGQNKSDLDSAIVIISLMNLIFNNIAEDFPYFKSKMYSFAEKGFEFIYKMLITTGLVSLFSIFIVPCIKKIVNLSINIDPKEYYHSNFFYFSLIYFLVIISIGFLLRFLRNKFKGKNNISYASFWIFILILYIYSIIVFYNK